MILRQRERLDEPLLNRFYRRSTDAASLSRGRLLRSVQMVRGREWRKGLIIMANPLDFE